MTHFVTKAGGARQLFDKEKIVKTCLRIGTVKGKAMPAPGKLE